jgi:hypothetical protein
MIVGFDYFQMRQTFGGHLADFINAMKDAGHTLICVSVVPKRRARVADSALAVHNIPVFEITYSGASEPEDMEVTYEDIPGLIYEECEANGIEVLLDERSFVRRLLSARDVNSLAPSRLLKIYESFMLSDDDANVVE